MAKKKNEPSKWQSKIVGHGKVAASQLLANPFNHRRHPEKQRQVVAASIEELGFIKSVLVNRLTGHIVDGHERVMQALGVGDDTLVDVEYVELSPEDEKKALLILDASSELAGTDAECLDELLRSIQTSNDALGDWFAELAESAKLIDPNMGLGEPQGDALNGEPGDSKKLADRFGVVPFSVLNAREGWWQDRKRAWLSLGIKSELGRGENLIPNGGEGGAASKQRYDSGVDLGDKPKRKGNASPGGSPRPACDYSKSKKRGDGKGKALS